MQTQTRANTLINIQFCINEYKTASLKGSIHIIEGEAKERDVCIHFHVRTIQTNTQTKTRILSIQHTSIHTHLKHTTHKNTHASLADNTQAI